MKTLFVLGVVLFSISPVLGAGPVIRFGQVSYSGSGCTPGTASIAYSPDEEALSLIFDRFNVEAGQGRGFRSPSINQVDCQLSIPMTVPAGYQVTMNHADFRGFWQVERFTQMGLTAQYSFRGWWAGRSTPINTPVYKADFLSPGASDFLLSKTPSSTEAEWSRCGGQALLQIKLGLWTKSMTLDPAGAQITLDSADLLAPTEFQLELRKCR